MFAPPEIIVVNLWLQYIQKGEENQNVILNILVCPSAYTVHLLKGILLDNIMKINSTSLYCFVLEGFVSVCLCVDDM